MADQQKRRKGKPKPLTANPLFPAVVALWCGAALGLPSLAIGPATLEALVIKSRIDLVIPAAAPPLGLTARILFALTLAVIGAAFGTVVARRLAQPRSERKERRRSARTSSDQPMVRTRDQHPDAPARRPISAHEELGETIAPEQVAPGALGNRRRSLAIVEEPDHFVPRLEAPLPGGEPQILDLTGAELDQASDAFRDEGDLNDYSDPAPIEVALPIVPADSETERVTELAGTAERQVFQSTEPVQASEIADSPDEHVDAGRQVFGKGPVEPADEASRQIFGASNHEPQNTREVVKAAGYKTSVFDVEPAKPLFADREANVSEIALDPAVAATDSAASDADVGVEQASLEVLPPLAGLGMTDLAVRLQESMRRRRAARSAARPAAARRDAVHEPDPAPQAALMAPPATPVPVATEARTTPPPIDKVPAALRPIALEDFESEDDDEELASLLPPRAIFGERQAAAMADTAEPLPEDTDEGPADTVESDAAYGSLLGIGTPEARTKFVRIEEPQPLGDAIEPVVIFPGQAPRTPFAASAAPDREGTLANQAADQTESGSFRRFDAPSNASAGQAVAANPAAPTIDRDEAERALRAALTSLQRISGAA